MNNKKNNKCIWDNFTQRYKVQKTLRFELKPVGKTEENIKKHNIIESHWENGHNITSGKDKDLADNYKVLKKAMNKMHQLFISKALDYEILSKIIKSDDIENLFSLWLNRDNANSDALNDNKKDLLQEEKLKFSKKLKEAFEQAANDWKNLSQKEMKNIESEKFSIKKNGVSLIHENSDSFSILRWLLEKNAIDITKDDNTEYLKKELAEVVNSFTGFTTYFSGFNQNRKNIYDTEGDNKKLKKTSIAHRILEENLDFFFANIQRWQKFQANIQKTENVKKLKEANFSVNDKLKRLQKELKNRNALISIENTFNPESFLHFISQEGIDLYNITLGGLPAQAGKEKIQGINEIINLTRQQLHGEKRDFSALQPLYKQILSDSERNFIDAFENDEDLIRELKYFYEDILSKKDRNLIETGAQKKRNFIEQVYEEFKYLFSEIKSNPDLFYLSREFIRKISVDLFGGFNAIDNIYFNLIENKKQENGNALPKAEKLKLKKAKTLSFKDINKMILICIENDPEALKETWPKDISITTYIEHKLKALLECENKNHSEKNTIKKNSENSAIEKIFKENSFEKKDEAKNSIKEFLDSALELHRFIDSFIIRSKDLAKEQEIDTDFQNRLQNLLLQFSVLDLYNKARNYLTKKPYSIDKIKLNFENSTLAAGWDINKETANKSLLFIKDKFYYLGIMPQGKNFSFDYQINSNGNENPNSKIMQRKKDLQKEILAAKNEPSYRKVNYKLLPGPNKMLPKVFFSDKNIEFFNPSNLILKIKENETFKKSSKNFILKECHTLVEFYKNALQKHPEWQNFNFKFTDTEKYEDISQFFHEVESQGYKISFDNIKSAYIDKLVDEGKLYLFQIYNKDFSMHSKGKENLHTTYWRMLFDDKNLKNVVAKLNGEAELFYRPASIAEKNRVVHKKGEALTNKNVKASKKTSKFDIDLIKDKRFTENKYFFHCPITLNFKTDGNSYLNSEIQSFLRDNEKVNILGIDRGEKHLLYYSLINQKGEILEQGSLNTVKSKYTGGEIETPYHEILDKKEKGRDAARKSWQTIENIKELKSGYLSQIVHKLARLIIDNNAIVVLEDLNAGFKRGRFKVEKQVYQKFERALIEKLNYLVFKEKEFGKPGHYLNAWQLTGQFESFEKLGKQSGILFYTTAGYTSKVDPVTGYMQNIYHQYDKLKTRDFFQKFESIKYNGKYFEFIYDLRKLYSGDIDNLPSNTIWKVCSCVERSRFDKNKKENIFFNVNEEVISLFQKANIEYTVEENLLPLLKKVDDSVIKSLHYYFTLILNLRVTDPDIEKGKDENDFISSPVEPFFNSKNLRESESILPKNGDANGAYNIARKGIIILHKNLLRQKLHGILDKNKIINYNTELKKYKDETLLKPLLEEWCLIVGREVPEVISLYENKKLSPLAEKFIKFIKSFTVTKEDWQNYAQKQDVVKLQIEKMK
ncbi:MAG: type V CRISPR-associated protein Cas12a/Cpf1 [Spirochaetia bacterium]|nr:type V CRISPR-associated protein Cas12a/Cpf1 [Spirochaetia bacterium]